jgi:hypothetical protein
MDRRVIKVVGVILGLAIGVFLLITALLWLTNGGWTVASPTGDKLPPHIQKVNPADGELVTGAKSFCVHFDFLAGNGMGLTPEKSMHFFYDGNDVTDKIDGLVTLDYPPSTASLCYMPGTTLSSGWHTAKVTYKDITNKPFSYVWRFQIQ